MTKCKCGCGKEASKGKTLIRGHYAKMIQRIKKEQEGKKNETASKEEKKETVKTEEKQTPAVQSAGVVIPRPPPPVVRASVVVVPPTPPLPPPTIKDREIALKEMELAFIQTFARKAHQNTHIPDTWRDPISKIFDKYVRSRFAISRQYCIEHSIPWNDLEFWNQDVFDYLIKLLEMGVPVMRGTTYGRAEVVELYNAYKRGELEQQKTEDAKLISG